MRTLGLIGLGAFGRLIVKHLAPYFRIVACDPDVQAQRFARRHAVAMTDVAECAAAPVVIIAVPVAALDPVAHAIAPHLRPGTLVLDVASVKVRPSQILQAVLPSHVDIVCTHPLFGPQSARHGIDGLKVVVCPIRTARLRRVVDFLERTLRLQVLVTTPDAHDREVAAVQGLVHLIAKVLTRMEPLPEVCTTRSYDLLMEAVNLVRHDSEDLFYTIEQENPFASSVRNRFFDLAAELRRQLDSQHIETCDGQ